MVDIDHEVHYFPEAQSAYGTIRKTADCDGLSGVRMFEIAVAEMPYAEKPDDLIHWKRGLATINGRPLLRALVPDAALNCAGPCEEGSYVEVRCIAKARDAVGNERPLFMIIDHDYFEKLARLEGKDGWDGDYV